MRFRSLKTGVLIVAVAVLAACSEAPVPSEVQLAFSQREELRGAGADLYAPASFESYLQQVQAGEERLRLEQERFAWFRDYAPVQQQFQAVLTQGHEVMRQLRAEQERERNDLQGRIDQLSRRLKTLRQLSAALKDARLARRRLVETELKLDEARSRFRKGDARAALAALERADAHIEPLIKLVKPLIGRYADPQQLRQWRNLVSSALAESEKKNSYLIVVSKLERELLLYKGGKLQKRYPAGMGFNFLSDKTQAGDRATPEGRYQVIKMVPNSSFYKALLINYPNDEDRARFAQAKKAGKIGRNVQIGGLIEIHGGGKNGMTNGCVALENDQMLQLFNTVGVGTPVVIVGTLDGENIAVSSLKALR